MRPRIQQIDLHVSDPRRAEEYGLPAFVNIYRGAWGEMTGKSYPKLGRGYCHPLTLSTIRRLQQAQYRLLIMEYTHEN